MITRVLRKVLNKAPIYRFGAQKQIHQHHDEHGHATHHHHHHHIELDKNASWVKFAENKKLVSLHGFEDQIDVFHGEHEPDYYEHMNEVSKYSLEYFLNDQANFHPDEHDPLANEPHGYFFGDDPFDARYNLPSSILLSTILITFVLGFSYYVGGHKDYAKSYYQYLVDSKEKAAIMEDNIAKLLNKRRQLDEENIKLRASLDK